MRSTREPYLLWLFADFFMHSMDKVFSEPMLPRLNTRMACAILAVFSIASLGQSPRQKVYDLPLPRAIGPGEALVARVSVGPLKAHQRIVVRVRSGEIAGTISPFGAQARQGPAVYTIPIPESAPKDGEVRLLVEVEEKNAETRAPTVEEVRSITLAYIAVTRSSKE